MLTNPCTIATATCDISVVSDRVDAAMLAAKAVLRQTSVNDQLTFKHHTMMQRTFADTAGCNIW
jgi:hypothetical protein